MHIYIDKSEFKCNGSQTKHESAFSSTQYVSSEILYFQPSKPILLENKPSEEQ